MIQLIILITLGTLHINNDYNITNNNNHTNNNNTTHNNYTSNDSSIDDNINHHDHDTDRYTIRYSNIVVL